MELNNHSYTAAHKSEVEQIFQGITKAKEEMQALYDEQTNHSQNEAMQAKWELYVSAILKEHPSLEEAIRKEPTFE